MPRAARTQPRLVTEPTTKPTLGTAAAFEMPTCTRCDRLLSIGAGEGCNEHGMVTAEPAMI